MKRVILFVGCLALLFAAPAMAANLVVVESRTFASGQGTKAAPCSVGVFVSNDVGIQGLVLPLELRTLNGGAYIDSIPAIVAADTLTKGFFFTAPATGRVFNSPLGPAGASWPAANITERKYAVPVAQTCSGPTSSSFTTSAQKPDFTSPDAVMQARVSTGDPGLGDLILMDPGTDPAGTANASFLFRFKVKALDGCFVIDTCCITPANHITYVDEFVQNVAVAFTKGEITVGAGTCVQAPPPVAHCKTVTKNADGTCLAAVIPADVDSGSTGTGITLALSPPGPYPLGTSHPYLVVTDAQNAKDSCLATIIVSDVTPPSITCPPSTTKECLSGIPAAAASMAGFILQGGTVSDNCPAGLGIAWVIDSPLVGGPCGGTITRVYKATDGSGNMAFCNQIFTVKDTTKPSISCPPNVTVACAGSVPAAATDRAGLIVQGGSAFDNCGTTGIVITHTDLSNGQKCPEIITRTYRATDPCGNFRECAQTITIKDSIAPAITVCPKDTTLNIGPGDPLPIVTYSFSASDNCGFAVVASAPPSGSNFPEGATTVKAVAQDSCDNKSDTCRFVVTVVRGAPAAPVARCKTVVKNADVNCQAAVTPAEVDSGSTGSGITLALHPPGPYPLGTSHPYLVVTDAQNQKDSCQATIIVRDLTKPTLQCPANIVVSNAVDSCGAHVAFPTPVVTDNCPGVGYVFRTASGSFFNVGPATTVWLVATDAAGNSDSCSFTVTVNDTQKPKVICPQNVVVSNGPDSCGKFLDFNALGLGSIQESDNCHVAGVFVSHGPGVFPVGVTTVKVWAKDDAGNTSDTCSFTVTVNDTQPPHIICPNDITVGTDPGKCDAVVSFNVTASDNCAVKSLVAVPPTGSVFPVGTTQVKATATDDAGNQSECTFNVTVQDREKPKAWCPGDIVVTVPIGQTSTSVTWVDSVTDNCPGATIACDSAGGAFFSTSTTTKVTCVATDAAGNKDTCGFNVSVENYVVTPFYPPLEPAGWMSAHPPFGTANSFFDVFFDMSNITGPGSFEGLIYVHTQSGGAKSGATVSPLDAKPETLFVNYAIGDPNPPKQQVQVVEVPLKSAALTYIFDSVVVLLNVTAPCLPTLDAVPDTLVFSPQTNCDSQRVDVIATCNQHKIGVGLPYTIAENVPWLSAAVKEPVTPGFFDVFLDRNAVPLMGWTGVIYIYPVITGKGSAGIPPADSVIVIVSQSRLVVSKDTLFFTFDGSGENKLCDTVSVTSSGCRDFEWCIPNQLESWLKVNPMCSRTPTKDIGICVNPCELEAGVYWGFVNFCPCACGSQQKLVPACNVVFVRLEVINPPHLAVDKHNMTFYDTLGVGGSGPQQLQISNLGGGLLLWSTHHSSPWLKVQPPSGNGNTLVTLSIDEAALQTPNKCDTLIDTLYVDAECALWSPQVVFVKLILCPPPPPPCGICGNVVLEDGQAGPLPGEGLFVDIWTSYPDGTLIDRDTVNADGMFCISPLDPGKEYVVRVWGVSHGDTICPEFVKAFCGDANLQIKVHKYGVLLSSPFFMEYYSDNAKQDGLPLKVGDVITAVDPQGVTCGVAIVTTPGRYVIDVRGDVPGTPQDEGASPGDKITFLLNCTCPQVTDSTWRDQRIPSVLFDVDFHCGRKTIRCDLCAVHTLASINILPDNDSLAAVLSSLNNHYTRVYSAICPNTYPLSWERGRPDWVNNMKTIDPYHGFGIFVDAPNQVLELTGIAVPPNSPLELCTEWNLISYLPDVEDTITQSLANISGKYNFVFGFECEGALSWVADRPGYLNDLTCLKPCRGYWIHMTQPATLMYPTSGYRCNLEVAPALAKRPVNLTNRVTITPNFADFWSTADAAQTGIRAGDVLTVRTHSGLIVGECMAGDQGAFMVHVYGDDPSTSQVEGAAAGEELSFEVNGMPAQVTEGRAVWAERQSTRITVTAAAASPIPSEYALLQNYPNPFNAGTVIPFVLKKSSQWSLTVYNVIGQAVRTFSGQADAGIVKVAWDGTAENGESVPSGVYFYRVQTPDWSASKKMTLLK